VNNVINATNPLGVCTLIESCHFFTIMTLKYEKNAKTKTLNLLAYEAQIDTY
jgi:hypothetical protein